MRRIPEVGIFKPNPSRADTKIDATTRVAREIVETTSAARAAKTERLRAMRLARETIADSLPAKKAPKKGGRKR
jgi:hypothetical protein